MPLKLPLRVEDGYPEDWIADADGVYVTLHDAVALANSAAENAACPLMHCHCGACGCAIGEDGKCNCADNRAEIPARTERDLRSKYLMELAALRKCETNDIPTFEDELAEKDAELERLRGLVRELRGTIYKAVYAAHFLGETRADYDAMTEAMLTPLSSLETARQAGGGE